MYTLRFLEFPRKQFLVPLYGLLGLLFCLGAGSTFGQRPPQTSLLQHLELALDSATLHWPQDTVARVLPLPYRQEQEQAQVLLEARQPLRKVQWLPSEGLYLLDSLVPQGRRLRFRLRFTGLSQWEEAALRLRLITRAGDTAQVHLPLQPYTETRLAGPRRWGSWYVGEEKTVNLLCNRPANVLPPAFWQKQGALEYRLSRLEGKLKLQVVPTSAGTHTLRLALPLRQPRLVKGAWHYRTDTLKHTFSVEASRLAFLDIKRPEVTLRRDQERPVEIQIEGHRRLQMNRTYRLEAQEKPGGPLVAELYTKAQLSNNRVLASFRPYALHKASEGYLYLKTGDKARFVTNLSIRPETEVATVGLQRQGEGWQQGQTVFPGETVHVRLKGKAMNRGQFSVYGAPLLEDDTLPNTPREAYMTIRVPMDVQQRRLAIYHNGQPTGKYLQVAEHHRPRPFNFIQLRLGLRRYTLAQQQRPIYYDETLSDLVIDFRPDRIDRPDDMYGRQELTIEAYVRDREGSLIELYRWDKVNVCPGRTSPRHHFYPDKKCRTEDLNLNDFLSRKTYNLPPWSSIELVVKHRDEVYPGEEPYQKRLKVVLQRRLHFDIDVSFPAGLLILKEGQNDFSNFTGISFAMLSQFSFYHPKRPGEFRPFKLGAGFIALDAFNFSENTPNRDVGLVLLGSVYPTSSRNKLSFPIYLGYGYLLKQKKGFFLVGPGIRVRL